MINYIKGTWFEFQHASVAEGKYWNESCAKFSEKQWEYKVKEIYETGMDYLVLMCTALKEEAYFETDIYKPSSLKCSKPLEAFLNACDKYNMKVFIGTGFYGDWTEATVNMTNKEVLSRTLKAMEQITALYSKHNSFYGWYLPDESFINKYLSEDFMNYVNLIAKQGRLLIPNSKILIAPYGTRVVIPDDKYIKQLENLDADIVAYQDEIGVRKTKVEESEAFYEGLYKAHEKAGRSELWADVEVFEFEGDVYKSALLPAPFERVKKQLKAVTPYVKNILIYQYQGMMNKPKSQAFAGHKDSTKLYEDYIKWMNEEHKGVIRK